MKKKTLDKVIETVNVITIPAAAVVAIWWDTESAVYVTGALAIVTSVCEYLKLFCKK